MKSTQARAFALFLLMHLTARVWFWDLRDDAEPQRLLVAILVTVSFLAALTGDRLRSAALAVATALALNMVLLFPNVSNHYFLELLCVTLVASLDFRKESESALFLYTCRRIVVIVLLSSGVQKILYGTYFDGQFLGYLIAGQDRFQDVFRWVLPGAELQRLTAMAGAEVGSGPFSIDSLPVILMSNAVYVFEILFGCLLLSKRTRHFAVWGAMAFVLIIELGARELMFGALFLNLLLLFLDRPLNRILLPFFGAGYLTLHVINQLLPWKAFN